MEHLGSQHRSTQNPRVHMPPYPIVDEDCGSGSVPGGIDTLVSPPVSRKSSSEAAVVSCPNRNSSSASVREWGSADSTPIERGVRPSSGHFRTSMSHRRPSTSKPAC